MKYFYMFLLLALSGQGFSQSNVDLYRLEKDADKLIAQGKLQSATQIYEKYKVVSGNSAIAGLDKKLENTRLLIEIDRQATEYFQAGKYMQSVDKFKQYRRLFPGISIARMDLKIEQALVQIEKQGSVNALNEKDKIIFGFEKNYLGEKALEAGEFEKARELYKSALGSVRTVKLKNSVGQQANERITQIAKCINILAALESTAEPKRKAELLDSYKSSGGIIIPSFEQQILSLRLQNETSVLSAKTVNFELQKLAANCDFNSLAAFVGGSQGGFYQTPAVKDSLYSQLSQLIADLNEIRTIKLSGDNSQRNQFVFGGYEALIISSAKIPLVGPELTGCLKKEYFSFLYATASSIYNKEMNLIVAREIAINARQYAQGQQEEIKINELVKKVNGRIGCEKIVSLLTSSLNTVDTNIDNCLLSLATSNFEKMMRASEGCMTPLLEQRIKITQAKIAAMRAKSSRFIELKSMVENSLARQDCQEAQRSLDQIKNLEVCNQKELDDYVVQTGRDISECSRKKRFDFDMKSADTELKDILVTTSNIEQIEIKIQNAKAKYEDAQSVALSGEQYQLKQLRTSIEKLQDKLDVARADRRKERLRNYHRIIKPELFVAVMTMTPKIAAENGPAVRTVSTTQNYEIGLNLRFLRRASPVGSSVGLHYATNDFQILNAKGIISEGVKADYLSGEYKLTTGFKRNSHPYLSLGLGAKVPIKTVYEDRISDILIKTDYFQPNNYVRTQVFSTLGLGFEGHRKNLGFSIEGFARFSGLLENDGDKSTTFPVLKQENFNYYQNSPGLYRISAVSWGFALTVHLW